MTDMNKENDSLMGPPSQKHVPDTSLHVFINPSTNVYGKLHIIIKLKSLKVLDKQHAMHVLIPEHCCRAFDL